MEKQPNIQNGHFKSDKQLLKLTLENIQYLLKRKDRLDESILIKIVEFNEWLNENVFGNGLDDDLEEINESIVNDNREMVCHVLNHLMEISGKPGTFKPTNITNDMYSDVKEYLIEGGSEEGQTYVFNKYIQPILWTYPYK